METISWRGYVVAVEMKKHPATSCPLTFLRSPKHIASVIRPPPVLRLPICRLRAKLFCCSHNPLSRLLLLRLHGKLLGIEDKNQSVARPEIRDLRLSFFFPSKWCSDVKLHPANTRGRCGQMNSRILLIGSINHLMYSYFVKLVK